MKYANLRSFEKHLEGSAPLHFSDVYLILSKESFERKAAVDLLVKTVLKGEPSPELCLHQFDGEHHSSEDIFNELETLAFFAKKRVIILHNIDQCDKASVSKLEKYMESPNRSVCLVITAPAYNRATNFYKKAEKVGILLDAVEEKPWEKEKSIAEWAIQAAGDLGKQLDQQTAKQMIQQLGTDQTLLSNELKKLVCFVGERKSITYQDVNTICTRTNRETGWQLVEAIFRRDIVSGLRIGKALLADGGVLIVILRQMRSQFQTALQVCSIIKQGGAPDEVAREFPFMRGALLEKNLQQAQNYGMVRLKEGLLKIDETELMAKNSNADPDFLLELLLIKLTVL